MVDVRSAAVTADGSIRFRRFRYREALGYGNTRSANVRKYTFSDDRQHHGWRHAKCTMNLDEVVSEIVERSGSRVICQLAGESIRHAGQLTIR
jgi:hypothetical protein